jgi:diguanylate cyclase (GGDEF)-like protein
VSQKRLRKIPLPDVLTIAFVVQVVTITGLVGYFSYQDGQVAVANLTNQLMLDVSKRVEQKLTHFLSAPRLANQISQDALLRGELSLDLSRSEARREQYLWQTMRMFKDLAWISWGSEAGDTLGVFRPAPDQPLQLSMSNQSTQHYGNYYAVNDRGQRTRRLKIEKPAYDPRPRPWYQQAVAARKPIWTKIYPGFSSGTIFLAASQPLYDAMGRLVGVSGTDIALQDLQTFLQQNPVSPSGQVFLIERSGLLVASSSQERLFQKVDDQVERLDVRRSQSALMRATAQSILEQVRDFQAIRQRQNFRLRVNQQQTFVQVVPFTEVEGLDWLIVMIVPESDVMNEIHAGTTKTIALSLMALAGVILFNSWVSRRIAQPIKTLSRASQKMIQGDFSERVKDSQVKELSVLASSFNQMSQEIQDSRQQLEEYSRSLEQKVNERTQALQSEVQRRAEAETALQVANVELQKLAYLDSLTQIANRRHFDQRLEQEWLRLQREQSPLSLILGDVDFFKQYNDTYGHVLGDQCLQQVAQAIAAAIRRPADLAARYGGEEFIVLLPNTPLAGAITIAEQIQVQIQALQIPHQQSQVSSWVTMSFGVATQIPSPAGQPAQFLEQVDHALYQAKMAGRNQVAQAVNKNLDPG